MIRIIKTIFYSIFWRLFFDAISKVNFIQFIENLNVHLRTLNVWQLSRLLRLLITDTITDNPIFRNLTLPFGIDLKILVDSVYKKLFLFGFIFTLIANIWLSYFKKIILWPFKLGIFSFVYSIFGFDVSWFLNIFSLFPLNIPNWVYFQYMNLYNNWLNWWHNTAGIKSITSVPVKETINKIKNKVTIEKDLVELENPKDNKLLYITGIATVFLIIGFTLWYFDVFSLLCLFLFLNII